MAGGKKKKKKKTVREIIERAFFLSLSKVAFSEGAFLLLLLLFFFSPSAKTKKRAIFGGEWLTLSFFSLPELLRIYQVHRIVCACAVWYVVCEIVSRFSKRGMKMHREREMEKKISFRSERKSGAKNGEENSPGEIVSFYSLAKGRGGEGRGKKGSPPIK